MFRQLEIGQGLRCTSTNIHTGMALGDVYQALQTKTIDGAENPLATLYGKKLPRVAKYLILDGHVKNFTTWVVSADWFNSLPEEQQTWLPETAEEAGEYNNEVQQAADAEYLQKMKDEGVTVVELRRGSSCRIQGESTAVL